MIIAIFTDGESFIRIGCRIKNIKHIITKDNNNICIIIRSYVVGNLDYSRRVAKAILDFVNFSLGAAT